MNNLIERNYLEIKDINKLKEAPKPKNYSSFNLVTVNDFQLNKFFYKQIGKNHRWIDRLEWNDQIWIDYISNDKVLTFVLKEKNELVGFFELLSHDEKKEIEIAYFGILEKYFGKKLGGFLLTEAIRKAFSLNAKRVWVHTCTLDHPNAILNYKARGMSIFKSENHNL